MSIVQAWDDFSFDAALFPADLKVRFDLHPDTPKNTEKALKSLPKEWTREKWSDPDVLHIEAHGNAVNGVFESECEDSCESDDNESVARICNAQSQCERPLTCQRSEAVPTVAVCR